MKLTSETVSICEAGSYVAPSGKQIEIARAIQQAMAGTVLYSPEFPPTLQSGGEKTKTVIEVINQTTFNALARLSKLGNHIGCLNFASAKNPGGGFLTGAQAQEEALARASALYPCLLKAPAYYERNRTNRSTIYLDLVIYSPSVPFFRNDDGILLEQPVLASVITAPAPNAGAVCQNEPTNIAAVEPALRRRADLVLQVAKAHRIDRLVLGAWGCGVFRNDPRMVAKIFAQLLEPSGRYGEVFKQVVFAVYDRSEGATTYRAFAETLTGGAV